MNGTDVNEEMVLHVRQYQLTTYTFCKTSKPSSEFSKVVYM